MPVQVQMAGCMQSVTMSLNNVLLVTDYRACWTSQQVGLAAQLLSCAASPLSRHLSSAVLQPEGCKLFSGLY